MLFKCAEIVANFLFLGSQDVAADLETLQCQGITHILNVASLVPNYFPNKFIYKSIEVLDLPESDLVTSVFDEAFDFIHSCQASQGRVLVHCNAGISRSASVVIAYLIKTKGIGLDQALALVKAVRPSVKPNPGFMSQLKLFESKNKGD